MNTTAESIKAFATRLPEGATISAKELLHLGERAAVDQALSRLVRRGELMRVKRGLFALPVKTRFGERAPSVQSVVEHIVQSTGETVSASGQHARAKHTEPNPAGILDVWPQPSPQVGCAECRATPCPKLAIACTAE